jgi:hypothetical protein
VTSTATASTRIYALCLCIRRVVASEGLSVHYGIANF